MTGRVGAALLGVKHDGAFTLLGISSAGERWRHLSPGRLIVVAAMRYFADRGVRTFDMGAGEHAFKRGFGIEPERLLELNAALTWKAAPRALLARTKARARANPHLKGLAERVRGKR